MRSRLADLQASGGGGGDVELGHVAVDVPEAPLRGGGDGGDFMAQFFGRVDDVKAGDGAESSVLALPRPSSGPGLAATFETTTTTLPK